MVRLSEHLRNYLRKTTTPCRNLFIIQVSIQILLERRRGGVTQIGWLLKASQNDHFEISIQPPRQRPGRGRILLHYHQYGLQPGPPDEGWLTGDHVVKDRAQTIDITCGIESWLLPRSLLRRHVGGGADNSTRSGQCRCLPKIFGQTKIRQERLTLVIDHDVGWFDITMQD